MSVLNGDTGIKILDGFNIFLSNSRFPIPPNMVDGMVRMEIQKLNTSDSPTVLETTFKVETTIHKDVFQIIDENRMAMLIAQKIQEVVSISYFGALKIKVKMIGIATGYNDAFNLYEVPNG